MIIEQKYIRMSIDIDANLSEPQLEEVEMEISDAVGYYYQLLERYDAPDVIRTNVTRTFKLVSESVGDKPTPKVKLKEVCHVCGSSVRLSPTGKLCKHDVFGNMLNFGDKIDRTAICDGSGKVPTKE